MKIMKKRRYDLKLFFIVYRSFGFGIKVLGEFFKRSIKSHI
jgi:hypothetical protein